MHTIVASTRQQAQLAARQLGLRPGGWRYATRPEHLAGVSLDSVTLALPDLGPTVAGDEVRAELRRLEQRDGKQVRAIWT